MSYLPTPPTPNTHYRLHKHTHKKKIPHKANGMLVIRTSSVRCPAVCVNDMPATCPSSSHFESDSREGEKKLLSTFTMTVVFSAQCKNAGYDEITFKMFLFFHKKCVSTIKLLKNLPLENSR